MTFAEQLTDAMKSLLSATHESGKAAARPGPNILNYISRGWAGNFDYLFYQAQFPENYEIDLNIPNAPKTIDNMFRVATGLSKLKLMVPTTDGAYSAQFFVFGSTSGTSTLTEMVLPDGIKFSNFNRFAANAVKLKSISFVTEEGTDGTIGIDLGDSSNNEFCFMSCSSLEEVRFAPGTIKKSFYIKQSIKLSAPTIQSIIDGLATVADSQDLSLHDTVTNKLTPEQKTAIANKNWNVI